MSSETAMDAPWSDEQLQRVAGELMRMYLEVERCLRPREHLRRFMTAHAYQRQYLQGISRFPDAGPVRARDLSRVYLSRTDNDRVYATAVARQHEDKWGALLLEMAASGNNRWVVTELTRAQDRNLTLHPEPREQGAEAPPTSRLRRTREDLALIAEARRIAGDQVADAHKALVELQASLGPPLATSPRNVRVGDFIDTGTSGLSRWAQVKEIATSGESVQTALADDTSTITLSSDSVRVYRGLQGDAVAQLNKAGSNLARADQRHRHWDREFEQLQAARRRLDARRGLEPWTEQTPGALAPEPPAYLTALLGSPPGAGPARAAWQTAATVAEAYRTQWHVTDTELALGEPTNDPDQRDARDDALVYVRHLSRLLRELGARDRDQQRAASRQGHELTLE